QLPTATHIDHDPQTIRAGNVVWVARNGKELMKRSVADGQLGGEDAMHPAGGAKRGFIGKHRLPGSQKRAVAARHHALLGLQHDVAIMGFARDKERAKQAARTLFVRSLRIKPGEVVWTNRASRRRRSILNNAADGRCQGNVLMCLTAPCYRVEPCKIAVAGCFRVIFNETSEEPRACMRAWG